MEMRERNRVLLQENARLLEAVGRLKSAAGAAAQLPVCVASMVLQSVGITKQCCGQLSQELGLLECRSTLVGLRQEVDRSVWWHLLSVLGSIQYILLYSVGGCSSPLQCCVSWEA